MTLETNRRKTREENQTIKILEDDAVVVSPAPTFADVADQNLPQYQTSPRVESQDEQYTQLQRDENGFREVCRRSRKKEEYLKLTETISTIKNREKTQKRLEETPALLMKLREKQEYKAAFQDLSKITGETRYIKRGRQTKSEDLFVEAENNDKEALIDILKGREMEVNPLRRTQTIQIMNIDLLSTKESVYIRNITGPAEHITLRDLTPAFGNTQAVTMIADTDSANKVLAARKVRVGLVNECRVRRCKRKQKLNRFSLCWNCCKKGH